MPRKIVNAKQVQAKSRTHTVKPHGYDLFSVTSGASQKVYTVEYMRAEGGATCTCTWGGYRSPESLFRSGCSHVLAVMDFLDNDRKISAWVDVGQAVRQHRPLEYIGDGVILTSRKAGT